MKKYRHSKTGESQNRKAILPLAAVAAVIIALSAWFIMRPATEDFMSDGVLRVCLDAGHGGED